MQLSKGDKVKFLNDIGGGVVAKVIDAKTVLITDNDGFEAPFLMSDLVLIEDFKPKVFAKPDYKQQAVVQNQHVVENSKKASISKLKAQEVKVFLAIVPKNDLSSPALSFDLYLLNDGSMGCYFVATYDKAGKQRLIDKGEVEPDTSLLLTNISKTRLQEYAAINLQLIFFDENDFQLEKPLVFNYPIDAMNIAKSILFTENDYFDEKALVINLKAVAKPENYSIKEVDLNKVIAEKEQSTFVKKKIEKIDKQCEMEEIDLHIEEIVDNHSLMEPGEIITIQLARFTTALETAMNAKTKRIVFIHGVGNGKLKFELRKTLDQKYSFLKYQDASFAEYGFGATMVIIKS